MPRARRVDTDDSVASEPEVVTASANVTVPASEPTPAKAYDHELEMFKSFGPSLRKDMGYVKEDDPMFVQNVPMDMCVSWATDPRMDSGAHLSLMRNIGYRPVRKEEVTTNLYDADKMVLRSYEVGPHDYVVVGGGVMLLGYRQYHDERRASERAEALRRLDDNRSRLDTQGVEQRAVSRSGPLSEVM